MKRPLMPVVLSYIYGIVAAELFRYLPVTVSLVSMLLFVVVVHLSKNKALLSVVIVGVSAGFFYMLYDSRVALDDISHFATGEKMTVIGMVDEPARYSSQKVTANLHALKILKGEKGMQVSGRVRVTVYDPEVILDYGDIIRLTGRLKIVRGFKNPGLFDYSRYVAREGIRATISTGKMENISMIGRGGNPMLRKIYVWREEIRRSIVKGLSASSSAILQAMVVGSTGDLTNEIRDQFNAAGVTHILSISGSHLGFVTLLAFLMIRYALLYLPHGMLLRLSIYTIPTRVAALGTFPPVIFYTLLSGGEVATVRSLIMALLYMIAIWIERDDDSISTLAMAAFVVLLWDPQALFDISFQLSYMAVLSMILVTKRFFKKGGGEDRSGLRIRYWKRFKLLLLLSAGASISTAPIVAYYYNQITWVGLISNLIVVPFAGFAVLPVGLFSGALALLSHADSIPLVWVNEMLLSLLYHMVEFFARFPLSIIYTSSPGILLIISLYISFFSLLFFKNPWAKILLVLPISLMVILPGVNHLAGDREGVMRVTFLDVGQGDSALIEFSDGKVMLIDGGGTFSETFDIGRSVVAPYLWNRGIRTIDYMVSTHPQLDHVEGLAYIAMEFTTGEVWTNGIEGVAASHFNRIIKDKGIKEVIVHGDIEDRLIGGCRIHPLNPTEAMKREGWEANDLSIVMRLVCKDISLLFASDIEARAIREIGSKGSILKSTVIKVPHHGARGSVEENFISAVRPAIAVISAGYQNSYHHPSPEAISAYERAGAAIYRTDQDGAVIIEVRDGRLRVKRYRDMVLREANFGDLRSLLMAELSNLQKIVEGYRYGS